jgi:predicted transglutaminase-like cysteine proteinase
MRIFILAGISALFLFSCKPSKSTETITDPKVLEDSLMAIHDVVMPKLTDIQDLESQLRKIKEAVPENSAGKIVAPDGFDQTSDALKLADQGMWDWMKQYHDQRDSIPADQLLPFLTHQMELLKSVQNQVNTSITKAQDWLKANGGTHVQ